MQYNINNPFSPTLSCNPTKKTDHDDEHEQERGVQGGQGRRHQGRVEPAEGSVDKVGSRLYTGREHACCPASHEAPGPTACVSYTEATGRRWSITHPSRHGVLLHDMNECGWFCSS